MPEASVTSRRPIVIAGDSWGRLGERLASFQLSAPNAAQVGVIAPPARRIAPEQVRIRGVNVAEAALQQLIGQYGAGAGQPKHPIDGRRCSRIV